MNYLNENTEQFEEVIFDMNHDGFMLTVRADPDPQSLRSAFPDHSRQQVDSWTRQMKKGMLIHASVDIAVHKDGKTGHAYLGSCMYENVYTMIQEGISGYLPDLIKEAIEDWKG